jgi:hypothetical protein
LNVEFDELVGVTGNDSLCSEVSFDRSISDDDDHHDHEHDDVDLVTKILTPMYGCGLSESSHDSSFSHIKTPRQCRRSFTRQQLESYKKVPSFTL